MRCPLADQSIPTVDVKLSETGSKTNGRHFRWLTDKLLVNIFLWPTFLLLLFITVFPLLWSLYLSFTSYSPKRDAVWTAAPWVGLQNYAELLADNNIWARFTTSAAVVIPTVLLEFLLGFGIAFLFNRHFKG